MLRICDQTRQITQSWRCASFFPPECSQSCLCATSGHSRPPAGPAKSQCRALQAVSSTRQQSERVCQRTLFLANPDGAFSACAKQQTCTRGSRLACIPAGSAPPDPASPALDNGLDTLCVLRLIPQRQDMGASWSPDAQTICFASTAPLWTAVQLVDVRTAAVVQQVGCCVVAGVRLPVTDRCCCNAGKAGHVRQAGLQGSKGHAPCFLLGHGQQEGPVRSPGSRKGLHPGGGSPLKSGLRQSAGETTHCRPEHLRF